MKWQRQWGRHELKHRKNGQVNEEQVRVIRLMTRGGKTGLRDDETQSKRSQTGSKLQTRAPETHHNTGAKSVAAQDLCFLYQGTACFTFHTGRDFVFCLKS